MLKSFLNFQCFLSLTLRLKSVCCPRIWHTTYVRKEIRHFIFRYNNYNIFYFVIRSMKCYEFWLKYLVEICIFCDVIVCHWMSMTHTVNLHGCSFLTLAMKDEDILNLWKMKKYPMAQCYILEDFNFEQQSCENPRFCMKVVAYFIPQNNVVLTLNFKISIWRAFCMCLRLLHSIIWTNDEAPIVSGTIT